MNTIKLKRFASKSRELLINEVTSRIKYLEVRDINKLPSYYKNGVQENDVSFSEGKKLEQRKNLIARVSDIGEEQVIEEISYLWFNRFMALRYMEVNGYLSYGRVVSSDDETKLEPDLIRNATHLVGLNLDNNIIYEFLDNNNKDGLYKYLIIHICNSLHSELPFMFEKISDYTELLFPDNILEKDGFLDLLVNEVDKDGWKEVEVLGWLYQYYISDKKDIVFNEMKTKKKKISKENIPAATQLFTPKWIVKYMVQNSVGKTWLESHPNTELQAKWEYYIESESTTESNPNLKPEEITVLDPAMGSGHILVYAFEILFDIYKSAGYTEDEIPKLIIENNLYGLEIDDRAWQIACFAIMMKARKVNKKILKQGLEPRVCSIQESSECDKIDELIYPELSKLCIAFKQGKLLGSLITLEDFNEEKINEEFEAFEKEGSLFNHKLVQLLPLIIKQSKLICRNYSCVVSNPPYMGAGGMDKDLAIYLKKNYPDTKNDLFSAFIERNLLFTKLNGYTSMITMHSWMFLSSFEKLRKNILETKSIETMLHLGYGAIGISFGTITFCIKNTTNNLTKGNYFKLYNKISQNIEKNDIIKIFLNAKNNHEYKYNFDEYRGEGGTTEIKKESSEDGLKIYYTKKQDDFISIPGYPIAYSVSEQMRNVFENGKILSELGDSKSGLQTGNNDLFLRQWYEINNQTIGFNIENEEYSIKENYKWLPQVKGGAYRKWYGNFDYIVNWYNNGYSIRNYEGTGMAKNTQYYYKKGLTWSHTSSSSFSLRYLPSGFLFNVEAPTLFKCETNLYILGLLNTKIMNNIYSLINPTLHYLAGDIAKLPIIFSKSQENIYIINSVTQQNINISKEEWDSRETSWDFSRNELLKHKTDNSLESAYNTYCKYWEEKFLTQHKNEEELNRLFIEIYGLEDEMTSEVELKNITLLKDETKIIDDKLVFQKDEIIKQFISYVVGCMMGRYSLDTDGLAFAGGEFDISKYTSFEADDDGIIPVLSNEYFEDDIVARFREFVKVAFGEEELDKNLDFIATALKKKTGETSLQRIRRYFSNEFYTDHHKRYKKRPIYWMFTTGKDKSFSALVYLHRYNKGTISKIRMDYLHKLQGNLRGERTSIETKLIGATGRDEITLTKDKENVIKQIDVLKDYDEKLKHLGEQKIELDLDDGVKVNYPKLGEILEKIKL